MATVNALTDTTLSIVLPSDKFDDIINAWCVNEGYVETTTDDNGDEVPNPIDKTTFTIDCLRTLLTRCYVRTVADDARRLAEEAAAAGL